MHPSAASQPNTWQFGIRRLLLVTAETAVLLAIARIVLPRRALVDEFWTALTTLLPAIIVPAAASLTILPAVFLAISTRRTWRRGAALGAYLLVAAVGLSCLQFAYVGAPNYLNWGIDVPVVYFQFAICHLSAAATILLTFHLLRRIGYDFRRRDEGPLPSGRSSSNARNSAASASA